MEKTNMKRSRSVRLGDIADDALKAVADGKERNLSDLARKALRVYLNPEQRKLDPRPLIASLEGLRQDLARVGSNLNQLAYGFNSHGTAAFDRDALAVSHDELRAEFRTVIEMLLKIERTLKGK